MWVSKLRAAGDASSAIKSAVGADKQPSGSLFVPDIPYFVGLFLCNGDRVGHPYVGRHYRDSGRYVCLGSPASREPLTSRFDLAQGIRQLFGQGFARAVSGYSISVDTSSSGNQGRSSTLIKCIKFFEVARRAACR